MGLIGFLFFKPVELSLYSTPIVLNEVFADSTIGVWETVEFMQHDCTGCETRNHHILSIASDSSGILIQEIDQFQVLLRPPLGKLVFGYSQDWGAVESSKVGIRGNCLVIYNSERDYIYDFFISDSAALNHFNTNYKDYRCNIRPNEFPIAAYKIQFFPDRVVLTP